MSPARGQVGEQLEDFFVVGLLNWGIPFLNHDICPTEKSVDELNRVSVITVPTRLLLLS